MNVEVKQLKDTLTGEVFVPLTHWDAVANKPEDIAKESTVISLSQDVINTVNALAQALSQQMLANTGDLAKELTNQEINNKLNDAAKESTSQEILNIWDAVSSDSEEIISDEDIHAAVEDIWNITFNS